MTTAGDRRQETTLSQKFSAQKLALDANVAV
jgi:hypothetical protein